MQKAYDALPRGGRLIVYEWLIDDARAERDTLTNDDVRPERARFTDGGGAPEKDAGVQSGVSESQSRADQRRSRDYAAAACRGRKVDPFLRREQSDRNINPLRRDEGERPKYEIRGKDGPSTLILFISNGGRPQGENE